MSVKTFAQYLIESILPDGVHIERQIDKNYLETLLSSIARKYPDKYGSVVSNLKRLGDRFSTFEPVTIGIKEISPPDKAKRDAIVQKYVQLVDNFSSPEQYLPHLENLQKELASIDVSGSDDATLMLKAALGNKRGQMMKARTSPGVVKDYKGNISPIIFHKSYAEGIDPVHFWLGAAESRSNVAEGQISTSAPGELGKVIANVMNGAVVSIDDCGTNAGILLNTKDEDVIGRYLARNEGKYARNTLITSDIQKELLNSNITKVLVRSPQTCEAPASSVCQKCLGLRYATGKHYNIGDNAGLISAGTLSEPLTQMTLSAKHSTSLAAVDDPNVLKGEKGFRKFTTMPKNYSNKKVLCEVFGTVFRILPAPQGGKFITIQKDLSMPVPERYVVNAVDTPNMKNYVDYYVPPNLKILEDITKGTKVYPGMPLSNGIDNLQDIARLRNIGMLRSAAAQGIYDIYKNTGNKIARVHSELLVRQAHNYVRIEKAPAALPFNVGDVVEYSRLIAAVKDLPKKRVDVNKATGTVLGTAVLDLSVGTELDGVFINYLKNNGVKEVDIIDGLEVSAVAVPLTRVVNMSEDWLSALNHRNLKTKLKEAASFGQVSDIHGFKPIAAYAYGVEMRQDESGKY